MSRVLVVTSVHPPDDPRIRHKTVATLAREHHVRYATAAPGPATRDDHEWWPLPGPRPIRTAVALRPMLSGDVDVVSIHDPELLPAALTAHRLTGVPVVFDVHEDHEARVEQGAGPPGVPRSLAIAGVRRLLASAERHCTITLAEAGYQHRFRHPHPVIPNHLVVEGLPPPAAPDPDAPVVYVGDVTAPRGILVLLRAMAKGGIGRPLVVVGRCADDLALRARSLSARHGVRLHLRGWLPHDEAMRVAAGGAVGVCPLLDVPNYRHSLPTKVLEYLAVGIPVVASDLPGTREAIGGLPGVVLVGPGDPGALARGLEQALTPAARAAAAAGAGPVRDQFRWPAERLLEVYRRAL